MAASHNDRMPDGETYIDKYIEGVSAVESILNLDKLRQVEHEMTLQGMKSDLRVFLVVFLRKLPSKSCLL